MINEVDGEFIGRLREIQSSNTMYDYEDVYSDYVCAQINQLTSGQYGIVIRCDKIMPELFWHIRYLRSMHVEPRYILSRYDVAERSEQIQNIEVITYEDLICLDTSKLMLLIVNRESDFGEKEQIDYREDQFSFVLRERARMGYFRKRSVENYFYLLNHEDEYAEIIQLLHDRESKECFVECVRALVENDIYRKKQYPSSMKYFDDEIFQPNDDGIWLNCGAATGDTILRFINGKRKCNKIYAIDIDSEMVKRLKEIKTIIDTYTNYNIKVIQKKLQKGTESIDFLFGDEEVSLINMDVEGAEMQILESAEELIRSRKPVLAICAYHKPEDLIQIPKYIKSIQKDYHFFLRKYKGCWPDAINEYVYYAVPTSRLCR